MPILSVFIAVMLLSGLNAQAVTRQAPLGSGTQLDPYQIASLANLSWLAQDDTKWSAWYIQTADIDAAETRYWDDADDNIDGDLYNDPNDLTATGTNQGFYPIGNLTTYFHGHYNGQGYTIDNLYIHRTDDMGTPDYSVG
ncbi:MAG: hypothetical protein D3926_09605, partial [Desulfobacteraceae bacterium]